MCKVTHSAIQASTRNRESELTRIFKFNFLWDVCGGGWGEIGGGGERQEEVGKGLQNNFL